ncbi:MAG: hypothetical protein HY960_08545 [Ignavibacteriae bacterium]|nr:hypothetical protein [Ignavibacteriota bacterium]
MLTKTQLQTTIEKLPEQFTVDQLIDYLVFTEKVERGLQQSEAGLVNSKEEAVQKLRKWLL